MNLQDYLKKLDEAVGSQNLPKYPNNKAWQKQYSLVLEKAIEFYKPGIKHLALKALRTLKNKYWGEDTLDLMIPEMVDIEDDATSDAWWKIQENSRDSFKQLDAKGLVSRQFHDLMSKNTNPNKWKAIDAFYDSLEPDLFSLDDDDGDDEEENS
jgi:hypothetical protein